MMDRKKREALLAAVLLVFITAIVGCSGEQAGGLQSDTLAGAAERVELHAKLQQHFESPDVHFELAQSYRKYGLWRQAKYHYESALRFDPINRGAQAAVVKILLDRGQQSQAAACAKQYIKQAEYSLQETMKLGRAFEQEGAGEYAFACYQQAVKLSPESPEGHKALGWYYLSKNNDDMAKECLKQSYRLDPSQAEVAGELGRLGVIVTLPRTAVSAGEMDKPG